MTFVIDTNVLMSILISGRSYYKTILHLFRFSTPGQALIEIDKYSDVILRNTTLNVQDHCQYAHSIFAEVTILPDYLIDEKALKRAAQLIGQIDPKDVNFLALAIQTDTILLTRDKPIYEAARKNGYRKIMLFDDFLRSLT
ncbi:PIN domain-containing protein [Arsenicibacter rosenii]|uniref:DNA-binding protein n=1 Tax=Arsenicibacter rosenii TaxID=1750698 RepID=A0A1S2VIU3_9BACT|nr:PIN domain-containing protein [Arsenicibacter rosenii]OIN58674.1 DNA-binding protein [Arsenicibacter rosenii]